MSSLINVRLIANFMEVSCSPGWKSKYFSAVTSTCRCGATPVTRTSTTTCCTASRTWPTSTSLARSCPGPTTRRFRSISPCSSGAWRRGRSSLFLHLVQVKTETRCRHQTRPLVGDTDAFQSLNLISDSFCFSLWIYFKSSHLCRWNWMADLCPDLYKISHSSIFVHRVSFVFRT